MIWNRKWTQNIWWKKQIVGWSYWEKWLLLAYQWKTRNYIYFVNKKYTWAVLYSLAQQTDSRECQWSWQSPESCCQNNDWQRLQKLTNNHSMKEGRSYALALPENVFKMRKQRICSKWSQKIMQWIWGIQKNFK